METLNIILLILLCIFLLELCILAGGFTIRFFIGWDDERMNKRLLKAKQEESNQ